MCDIPVFGSVVYTVLRMSLSNEIHSCPLRLAPEALFIATWMQGICIRTVWILCDFRLPVWCKWGLHTSVMLCSFDW